MAGLDHVERNGTIYEIVPEIAPLFDTSTAYAKGDCVVYAAKLYRFKAAHDAGAWAGTDADEITVSGEIDTLNSTIAALVDSTLAVSGKAADAKAAGDAISALETSVAGKAVPSGVYSDMVVGDLLSSDRITDNSPYLMQAIPTGAGGREYPEVVGGSFGWNQLVADTGSSLSVTVPNGHKYLMKKSGTWSIGASTGTAITGLTGGTDMVCDLTLDFGSTIADYAYTLESGTAGAGIAWLRKYGFFEKPYYAYNAGAIKSVSGVSKHVTVGVNQWDGESESGYYDHSDGTAKSSNNFKRSKNAIPCIPNTTYYFKYPGTYSGGSFGAMLFYDASDGFISSTTSLPGSQFTTPSNCYKMRFYCSSELFVDEVSPICINLSNPLLNGRYMPYVKHEYTLDSSLTLRGILKKDANNNLYYDGDTYEADGTVTRKYADVDLGDLEWSGSSGLWISSSINNTAKRPSDSSVIANIVSEKYTISAASPIASNDGKIGIDNIGRIQCGSSATPSGKLVYELSTASTEEATAYTSPQEIEAGGTESYVITTTEDVEVPVGNNAKYLKDLKGELERVMVAVPKPPTANGTYKLQVVVSGGNPTYSWSS